MRALDTWDGAAASFGQRRYFVAHDQTPDSPPDRPRSRLPRGPGEALRRRHGPPGRRVRPPLCRRPRQSDRSQPPSQGPQKAQALADLPRNTQLPHGSESTAFSPVGRAWTLGTDWTPFADSPLWEPYRGVCGIGVLGVIPKEVVLT